MFIWHGALSQFSSSPSSPCRIQWLQKAVWSVQNQWLSGGRWSLVYGKLRTARPWQTLTDDRWVEDAGVECASCLGLLELFRAKKIMWIQGWLHVSLGTVPAGAALDHCPKIKKFPFVFLKLYESNTRWPHTYSIQIGHFREWVEAPLEIVPGWQVYLRLPWAKQDGLSPGQLPGQRRTNNWAHCLQSFLLLVRTWALRRTPILNQWFPFATIKRLIPWRPYYGKDSVELVKNNINAPLA